MAKRTIDDIFHMNFIYFFNWLKNNPFPLEIIKSKFSAKIETISHSYLRFIVTPIYFVGGSCFIMLFVFIYLYWCQYDR
jgi:hypothetical protein